MSYEEEQAHLRKLWEEEDDEQYISSDSEVEDHDVPYETFQQQAREQRRRRVSSRCMICPRAKDRKTFYCCQQCGTSICMEHANLFCQNCTDFEAA